MTYANSTERQALISGLRALAGFLESKPDVPAPAYADVLVFPPSASDAGPRREIDVIASRIGSGTEASSCHPPHPTALPLRPSQHPPVPTPPAHTPHHR